MRLLSYCVLLSVYALLLCHQNLTAISRPNVLLIIADDLGFSDLGCYGGEISTPNLDRLAGGGIRFSNFRATPMCSTTRVALIAGMSYQSAGMGSYRNVLPLPVFMKQAGYRTMFCGKWHAGNANPRSEALFDRSFGFLGGMTDCYAGGNDWFECNKPYKKFGRNFDATSFITSYSIKYMQEALKDDDPFFMVVSYNAPHHPLQARKKTVEKYLNKYSSGYEKIREARYKRQLSIGLIDPTWDPVPAGVEVRVWEELPKERQVIEDFRMAAYAAMVDEMDQGIGRIIKFLENEKRLENTLIIFMSDNGGDYNNGSIFADGNQIPWKPGNNPTSSNGWAWVKNCPFSKYKHACHEGALAVPFIVHWPSAIRVPEGSINHSDIAVTDIYPTLVEMTGAQNPGSNDSFKPLEGRSFLNTMARGATFNSPSRFISYRYSKAWIEDNMKAVSLYGGSWELYDIRKDRTEQFNLANSMTGTVKEFSKRWNDFAKGVGMSRPAIESVEKKEHGWGWHRMQMFAPQLVSTYPENSKLTSLRNPRIEMHFSASIDLAGSKGKFISLYKVSDESKPIWKMDPDKNHPGNGTKSLIFNNLPPLEPDTQYFILIDRGAFKVGGKPVGVINDGAYWWRFRTHSN